MIAFDDCNAAVEFAMEMQAVLLTLPWPEDMLLNPNSNVEYVGDTCIWNGLRVRVGMHFGPVDRVFRANTYISLFVAI